MATAETGTRVRLAGARPAGAARACGLGQEGSGACSKSKHGLRSSVAFRSQRSGPTYRRHSKRAVPAGHGAGHSGTLEHVEGRARGRPHGQ